MEPCALCGSPAEPLVRCGVCREIYCNNFDHKTSHIVRHLQLTGHDHIEPISEFYIPSDALYCNDCETKGITSLGFLPTKADACSGMICCVNCRMYHEQTHDTSAWRPIISTHIDSRFFPGHEDADHQSDELNDGDCTFTGVESYYTPLPSTDMASKDAIVPSVHDILNDDLLFTMDTYRSNLFSSLSPMEARPQERQNFLEMIEDRTEHRPAEDRLRLTDTDVTVAVDTALGRLTKQSDATRNRRRIIKKSCIDDETARQEILASIVLSIPCNMEPQTLKAITARGCSAMVMWAIIDGLLPGFDFAIPRDESTHTRGFVSKTDRCHILSHFYCRRRLHYFHYMLPILALERLVTRDQLEKNQVPVKGVQFRCLRGRWSVNNPDKSGLAVLYSAMWEVLIPIQDISMDIKIYKGENFILRIIDYQGDTPKGFTLYNGVLEIPLLCTSVNGDNVAFFVHQNSDLQSSMPYNCVNYELMVKEDVVEPLTSEMAIDLKFTDIASPASYKHSHFISKPSLQYEIVKCDNDATYKRHVSAIARLCAYNQPTWNYLTSKKWTRILNLTSEDFSDSSSEWVRLGSFDCLIRFILLADYRMAHAFIDLYKQGTISRYGEALDGFKAKTTDRKGSRDVLSQDKYSNTADPLIVHKFFNLEEQFKQLNMDVIAELDRSEQLLIEGRGSSRTSKSSQSFSGSDSFCREGQDVFQVLSFAATGQKKKLSAIPWSTPYKEMEEDNLDPELVEKYANNFAHLTKGVIARSPDEFTINEVLKRAGCLMSKALRSKNDIERLINDLSAFLDTLENKVTLNFSQRDVIQYVLSRPITLVQGPPGCGKTFIGACLAWIFSKVYGSDNSSSSPRNTTSVPVLICCPSNTAAESLTLALEPFGLPVVRVVSLARQRLAEYEEPADTYADRVCLHVLFEEILKLTLLNDNPQSPYLSDFTPSKEARLIYENMTDEIPDKQSNDVYNYLQMKKKDNIDVALKQSAEEEISKAMFEIENLIISSAQVVICTCSTSYDNHLSRVHFSSLIVDESTQAIEPDTICAIGHGCSHIVLMGDHKQLGPIVATNIARLSKLDLSLYERLQQAGIEPHSLTVQYRMHPALSAFPSNTFYNGMLQNGVTQMDRQLIPKAMSTESFPWPVPSIPSFFWHVQGTHEVGHGTSLRNDTEILCVEAIVDHLLKCYELKQGDIGIVTPYDYQKCQIEMQLKDAGYSEVFVNSVDAFQGHEKEVIIFSTVRSVDKHIGFLKDQRRLNVGLTRCRCALIIVGNATALAIDDTWRALIQHYYNTKVLVAGRDLDQLFQIESLEDVIPKA